MKNIITGLTSGLLSILFVFSFASILFTGELKPYLSFGFGFSLVGLIILRLVIARFSSIPGIVATPYVVVYLFLALMMGSFSSRLDQSQILPTTLALIVLSTLAISISLLLLGTFKYASLIRYFPFPVVAGLLAAIGFFLVVRGIGVVAGYTIDLSNFKDIFKPELFTQVLISFYIAAFFYGIFKEKIGLLTAIGVLFSLAAIFSASYYWQEGFLSPEYSGRLYPPILSLSDAAKINWAEIFGQTLLFLSMIAIFILTFLVNVTGMEAYLKKEIDVDRETRITGFANLISALCGGVAGCVTATQTIPNIVQGGTSYLTAVFASLLAALFLLFDAHFINFVPKSLLGSVPIYLGMFFLVEWLYKTKSRLPLRDYLLLMAIFLITINFSFFYGLLAGIVLSAAIFIYSYSRTDVVKFAFQGDSFASNVERSDEEKELLKVLKKQVFVLKMQGFIFFGTAHLLAKTINDRFHDTSKGPIKYLVLDFSLVNKLDSSAVLAFSTVQDLSKVLNFTPIFTNVDNIGKKQLFLAGFTRKEDFFPSLDYAMEWIENETLASQPSLHPHTEFNLELMDILSQFEGIEFKSGDYILHQGDRSNEMYYIYAGKVTAFLQNEDGMKFRLRTMGPGTFIGELGFFSKIPRSCSVVAESHTKVFKISHENLKMMREKYPVIVIAFYEQLSRILSERIATQNQTLEHLIF